MNAADRKMIAEMVAAAVAAALPQADSDAEIAAETSSSRVVAVKPKRKRSQSTKNAPKATSARRKRGEKATEWIVRESWKGEAASTRMLGFAVKCGVPAAVLKRGDKYEVSAACGSALKLPVVVQD